MQGDGLNPAQAEAVEHGDGPLLILAGAGSGKTRVITHRIARLLDRGVPPWRILAVTFTNKAAGEMRERVEHLVGAGRARGLWMGTFHAVCARLLRLHAEAVGLTRDFVIFDDGDQKTLVTRILKEQGIADRFVTPRGILSAIDGAKNRGEGPGEYRGEDYFSDIVARVYPVYQQRLEEQNAVDFGDLLMKALELCQGKAGPEIAADLGGRFDHVLVDEFQDTNRVQYDLVRHFAVRTGNLCVVGDDDQSIYGWRGADVRNILGFERDQPGTRVVKLERNYRSTQRILDAANAVVARNLERKPKRLYTEKELGEDILYFTAADEREEAAFVAGAVRRLSEDEGRSAEDFAVLYRTHAQSRALEEAMGALELPYTIIGGTRFYDRAEVKDVIAYLRVLQNPSDEVSLERIINRPTRGIGDTSYERVVAWSRECGIPVWEALARVGGGKDGKATGLGPAPRKKIAAFVAMLDEIRQAGLDSVAEGADRVLERTGYLERLAAERTHEAEERTENVMELVTSMRDFAEEVRASTGEPATLSGYLERVALVASSDSRGRGVSMMTVHAAKGLEFPVAFVTGLEDGVFPSLRDGEAAEDLEEERRLMYVAITRARERLVLTNAASRRTWGQGYRPFRESRFLDDIPDHCIARPVGSRRAARPAWSAAGAGGWGARQGADEIPGYGSPDAAPSRVEHRGGGVSVEYDHDAAASDDVYGDRGDFYLGQRVRHAQFGEGEVRGLTGAGRDLKLTVYFPRVGPKTIVARFVEVV